MEEEWRIFLKENAPKLYENMLSSVKHAAAWRNAKIEKLQQENKEQESALEFYKRTAIATEAEMQALEKAGQLCYEALLNNQADNTAYKPEDWQKIQEAIKAWEDLQK